MDIKIPIEITDNDDNYLLNKQIQNLTSGDNGGEGISSFTIADIQEDADTLIPNQYMDTIPNVIVTTDEGDMVTFGAIAISESMAYLMERCCSPHGYKTSPEYPYMSAEKVADYYVPNFSNNKLNVLALCDMAQMSSNPGACFVRVMKGIRDGLLKINTPEDIYEHFYSQTSMTMEGNECSLLLGFQRLQSVVKQQLKSYLREMAFVKSYYEWIDRLFDFAWEWRKNDKMFLLKMARQSNLEKNNAWGMCIFKIGTPLMTNRNGSFFKITPNGMALDTDVEYFKSFFQIEQLFSMGTKTCGMYEWCKKSPLSTPSDICNSAPWEKSKDPKLCPYALIWRHWNLGKYNIK